MYIYFFLIITTFILSLFEFLFNKQVKKYLFLLRYFYIFFIGVLFIFNRYNNDYLNYISYFSGNYSFADEKGYLLLNKLVKSVGGNYHFILLILGIFFIYIFFYKYKTEYTFSIIFIYSLYLFSYDINQTRNLFCLLFILQGLYYLNKNYKFFYLIFNFLGISFHRIGYIYILFYFIQKYELKKYIKLIVYLFILGIFIVPVFRNAMLIFFPEKARFYFTEKINFGMLIYYTYIVIDIFILYIGNRKKKICEKEKIYLKFILFPIVFLPYSNLSTELIFRVYRNASFVKFYYFFKYLVAKNTIKINIILWFLLIFIYVSFIFIKVIYFNNYDILTIIFQMSNVEISF